MAFDVTDRSSYNNKVLGGWIGKCAGGILGAPIEGYKTFNRIELTDELFANNFANDDLDLQVLWLDMVAKKGPWVREQDFAEHWHNHVAFPWNEYGIATRNITLGLDIPDTGKESNWYWRESMGSPIRSEIWGMLFPGDPAAAARYARIDSELDHEGFSVHAEQFLSAAAALAFDRSDPRTLLYDALPFIPHDGVCYRLVGLVIGWYEAYGFDVAAGKIKSHYGDADFTSAPMNVAFTILAIVHAGTDFDRIMSALHLGHDSDCIVATAGAILGILVGAEAIPENWKKRVGNELLISPEVSGIRCPDTLTELADWTCEVGAKIAAGWPAPERGFALRSEVYYRDPLTFAVEVENFRGQPVEMKLELRSEHFTTQATTFSIPAGEKMRGLLATGCTDPGTGPTLPYEIVVSAGQRTYCFAKGVPNYGSWLLLGPFISAADELAPTDEAFPDHGMSSLPSVRYMNHDRVHDPGTELLGSAAIGELLAASPEAQVAYPFGVTEVRPDSMTLDAGDYFHGRGERSYYLTTVIDADRARRHWLCLGSENPITAWINGEEVLRERDPRRRWPGARVADLSLRSGRNILTLRIDAVVDDYRLDVGLKDHAGQHHHQSQWTTDLSFNHTLLHNAQPKTPTYSFNN